MIQNDWKPIMEQQQQQPYFQQLQYYLEQQYKEHMIYPSKDKIYKAFELTPFAQVKVVIVGQDPYHGEGQAQGLSFSVEEKTKFPPSLRNMFKELVDDIGCEMPISGDLTKWAKQGVLLLNTVLTVQQGKANSHQKMGWETFTDAMIQALVHRPEPVIFVLWGKPAQQKEKLIHEKSHHIIIKNVHPSPLSAYRGFFGSKPYSTINQALRSIGKEPIDWCLG